jgi:catechol 2,3-dioxygenase-like lactoylglutathione lyase family enzyme
VVKVNVPANIIKFPDVLVFLANKPVTGGTEGTTVDHIGFKVKDLRATIAKIKAAGYPIITKQAAPPGAKFDGDVALLPEAKATIAFVMGPDNVKVEFSEDTAVAGVPALHHVHFAGADPEKMQAWYVKTFNAKAISVGAFRLADLPGVRLVFSPSTSAVVGTKDHALDHLGFEVKNLEAFCKQLEAAGIKLERPYTKVPQLGIAIAFFTDPWGTYIELTEGLDKL